MICISDILSEFELDDAVLLGGVNWRCQQFNTAFPLPISQGGTGGMSSAYARYNLGVLTSEFITFSGKDTLTLSKSIKEFSYIVIDYSNNSNYWGYCHNSSCFSVDVLNSISGNALTISVPDSVSKNRLVTISAIMWVSGTGKTITLDRNKGFVKDVSGGSAWIDSNERINISRIIGYR